MIKSRKEVKIDKWIVNQPPEKRKEQKSTLTRTQKKRLQRKRTKERMKGMVAILEQSKKIKREPMKSPINAPK